jgi:hypothetical protein
MSPNAVDRRRSPAFSDFKVYLETQKQFYAPLQEIAEKHGATFVDQYAITRAALEQMEAKKAATVVPFGDGFHTSPPGGLLMAHTILTGLGAPAQVSNVVVDGSKADGQGCTVENLVHKDGAVAFDRTDDAIPFPVMNEWVTLLPYVNNLKDLNNYGLTVKGLAKGTYEISIDGKAVAKATAEELEAGVNLGLATAGPVYDQGMKVLEAINDKNRIVHGRFRGVLMFQAPDWLADVAQERKPKELAKRMEQINAKQAEIYKLAKPVTRKFSIQKG